MTTRLFGEPIVRREDPRLLRGDGRYLDDLGHGAYAVAFVRSPHAHARITDVDVTLCVDAAIGHKTEAGGVHIGVADRAALDAALARIDAIATGGPKRYLLEEMAPAGL